MTVLAAANDFRLAMLLIGLFFFCIAVALISLAQAINNIKPGTRWFDFMLTSPTITNRHPERYFTKKGLRWIRIGRMAIIATFVSMIVVMFFARL